MCENRQLSETLHRKQCGESNEVSEGAASEAYQLR